MNISTSRVRLRAITADASNGPPPRSIDAQADDALARGRAPPSELEIDEIQVADHEADE